MNKLTIAAQVIKDSVSALDVGNALGLEIRRGRCKCPIHNGGDYNCVLYKGNRGYYCHTCKSGGDVRSLVQQYYKMSFPDCVKWFNSTFNLGMDIESPMSPEAVKQAEIAQRRRVREREFREWKDRMGFDLHLTADQIVFMLERIRDDNVPKDPYEAWNRNFRIAIELLPEARQFAEDTMMDCIKQ